MGYNADLCSCWFNDQHGRCTRQVPADPDHIGLCDTHVEMLREDSYTRPVSLEKKSYGDGPRYIQTDANPNPYTMQFQAMWAGIPYYA